MHRIQTSNRGFHKCTKNGNNSINANFEFPYKCSFPLYLNQVHLGNMKINISDVLELCIVKLQSSLVLFIFNGQVKTKLAILSFLYCSEFMKTSIGGLILMCALWEALLHMLLSILLSVCDS